MKKYSHEFWEHGAHGRGQRLLARAGLTDGVVLDLGCASGPLAEPVAELGLEYVGADIDRQALDDLESRGFEAHELDLAAAEDTLVSALEAVLAGRSLAAVLLLDVIEHLVDPGPVLRAAARLDAGRGDTALIVSIPNITHVDVGIKLLLGRWDLTTIGLLDDTHVRFFNERLVRQTMADAGWVEADADDVVNPFSDQLFPADAPALRPGAPLRQLLWRVRMSADPFGETYQYVRRFEHNPGAVSGGCPATAQEAAEEPVFLSVIVRSTDAGLPALDRLLLDLGDQTDDDLEILVTRASGADGSDPTMTVLEFGQDAGWRDDAVAAARGRYIVFLDDTARVGPGFVDAIRRADKALPSRVVRTASAAASRSTLDAGRDRGFADLIRDAVPVDMEQLDIVTMAPLGSMVLAAHAVPREACASNGLRFEADGEVASSLFLIRAVEMCGIVRMSDCVSVVDESTVRELSTDLPFLAEQLDQVPMLLPEGAGSQLLGLRRTLASVVSERDDLVGRLADANERVTSLSWLVRNKDDELARLALELESLRGRVSARVRRRLGSALRRI